LRLIKKKKTKREHLQASDIDGIDTHLAFCRYWHNTYPVYLNAAQTDEECLVYIKRVTSLSNPIVYAPDDGPGSASSSSLLLLYSRYRS